METKKCTKCGEVKELGEYEKAKSNKDGLRSYCKVCMKEYRKKYYLDNPEKYKELSKKWALKNPEKVKEASKKWALKNPEYSKKQHEGYRLNNPDKLKEYNKKWKLKNLEKIKEQKRYDIEFLKDTYIKRGLRTGNIPITPETIELKRNIILIKRITKAVNGKHKKEVHSATE